MFERGDILNEVRKRYSRMFIKIPRHIKGLHTELVAQRKLNRRLSEELIRSRETINDLLKELEFVRQHDYDVVIVDIFKFSRSKLKMHRINLCPY